MNPLSLTISLPVINLILIILSVGFCVFGYIKKVIDFKSTIFTMFFALFFICLFPLYWFASLLLLYISTTIATKYKKEYKLVVHNKGREIKNLLSNLLPSLIFSFVYLFLQNMGFYFAFLCGVSCACADTLASEIGQLSKKNPRLITTLEEVKTGTEGGVSALGLCIGFCGALLVSMPSLFLGLNIFLLATLIGFIGCNVDSFVGAKFELKGVCSNETTNLIATGFSSILGLIVYLLL